MWFYIIVGLIIFIILIVLIWLLSPIFYAFKKGGKIGGLYDFFEGEDEYYTIENNKMIKIKCPKLIDDNKPNVYLSLIVPAYNEALRLPIMLDETFEFLENELNLYNKNKNIKNIKNIKNNSIFDNKNFNDQYLPYEIIIVSDGSTDNTQDISLSYAKTWGNNIRILNLHHNQGKGAAVRKGMLCARGEYLLMVDADGATDINNLKDLLFKLKKIEINLENKNDGPYGIAIGSRAHLQNEAVAKRQWWRTILMYGFHFVVNILASTKIRDTQCGFKLFTRKAAKIIYSTLHLNRWAFDVEIIQICQYMKIPMVEVAVNWHEVDGSKLITSKFAIITTSLSMIREMISIRVCYMIGLWKIKV